MLSIRFISVVDPSLCVYSKGLPTRVKHARHSIKLYYKRSRDDLEMACSRHVRIELTI